MLPARPPSPRWWRGTGRWSCIVCRQLVADYQHAEDTFQAVFVVLARRAQSVRDPDLLSHWLYGVALRTARKAKVRLARQRMNERAKSESGLNPGSGPPADRSVLEREQAEMLHDEIERLPRDFRLPIVLCYFEGLPLNEAARRLCLREGTLRSRLARARDKLGRSLTRRGVVLSAAALACGCGFEARCGVRLIASVRHHHACRDQVRGCRLPPGLLQPR